MSRTTRIADQPNRRLAVCLLLYVATGMGSVALTAGPDAVAPLYLAAGVAVACVLAWGPRMVWAVALGCALVELQARLSAGHALTPDLLIPMAITACGGALQAAAAGLLCRRWMTPGPALDRPREIAGVLLLAGPLACTVNAALSVGAMVLRGELSATQAPATALTWWYGDVIGVLIATPLTLILIGRPADLWRTRRLWVGLPMLVVMVLTVILLRQDQVWSARRAADALARDSASVQHHAQATLRHHLQALDSLWLLQQAVGPQADPRFAALATHWQKALPAVGAFALDERTTERLPGPAEGTLERLRVRQVQARPVDASPRAALAVAHRAMTGRDALDLPALRATWARAVGEGLAAASPGLPLPLPHSQAVILYRPLAGTAGTGAAAPSGAVTMVLEMDTLLRELKATASPQLQACLSDLGLESSQALRRSLADGDTVPAATLAGPAACGSTRPWQGLPHRLLDLPFGGRSWQLALWQNPAAVRTAQADPRGRLLAIGGLLLAAGLGALLMMMTGHTRRLQAATAEARAGRQQAEATMQAHSAFLSRVSHELRTPLHAMLGLGALMRVDRQHPPDPWQQQTLQQMDQAGQELLRAVDTLLQVARSDRTERSEPVSDPGPGLHPPPEAGR
ncbi:MAG: hypothetical protein RL223_3998 [Pseudomonadota bacterium]